jgi:hypothetical protein
MQFEADRILMEKALQALREGHLDDYRQFSEQARLIRYDDAISGPEPTEHERYLDVRRVWITAGLLLALFAVVALVLIKSSSAATATPYVSLLSGLAGIALGWMFANSGSSLAGRRSDPAPSTPPPPPAGTAH